MIIVMIAIGHHRPVFALDSIPAIFGLTKEPYLVFTANVFALMGLRQLYFLLGGLLDRLRYLSIGLAVVLGFIGVKLVLEALHGNNVPFINGGEPLDVDPGDPDLALAADHRGCARGDDLGSASPRRAATSGPTRRPARPPPPPADAETDTARTTTGVRTKDDPTSGGGPVRN